jgi:hypothetical protein
VVASPARTTVPVEAACAPDVHPDTSSLVLIPLSLGLINPRSVGTQAASSNGSRNPATQGAIIRTIHLAIWVH